MMLEYSFGLDVEAQAIDAAVDSVLEEGYRTVDLWGKEYQKATTEEMGNLVCKALMRGA